MMLNGLDFNFAELKQNICENILVQFYFIQVSLVVFLFAYKLTVKYAGITYVFAEKVFGVFHSIAGVCIGILIVLDPGVKSDFVNGKPKDLGTICLFICFSIGYFLYDLVAMYHSYLEKASKDHEVSFFSSSNVKKFVLRNKMYIVHHLMFALIFGPLYLNIQKGFLFFGSCLLMESSNPALIFNWYLKQKDTQILKMETTTTAAAADEKITEKLADENSQTRKEQEQEQTFLKQLLPENLALKYPYINIVNNVIFVMLFFIFRVCNIPFQYWTYLSSNNMSITQIIRIPWHCHCGSILILGLQLIWFSKILGMVYKILFKTRKDHSEILSTNVYAPAVKAASSIKER